MALDGIVVASLAKELQENFTNARLSKIAQPEKDELLLTMKGSNGQKRLLLSASASLPLVYISDKNKPSPMTAPNFCMLLRKHVANGRITAITQPGMERIIVFEIEHLDDLGDLRHKKLIIELMGKHSNIFCYRADVDGDAPCASLNEAQKEKLAEVFLAAMIDIREGRFFQISSCIRTNRWNMRQSR